MVYRIKALQSTQDYREALDYLNRYAGALIDSDEWHEAEVVRALVATYEYATYGNAGGAMPGTLPLTATGNPPAGQALSTLLHRAVQVARAYAEPSPADPSQYRFGPDGTASLTMTHREWRLAAAALGMRLQPAAAPPPLQPEPYASTGGHNSTDSL
jgi:hypothetical protein